MVAVFLLNMEKFLCKKAQVLHRMERSDLAKEAFEQAKELQKTFIVESNQQDCWTFLLPMT